MPVWIRRFAVRYPSRAGEVGQSNRRHSKPSDCGTTDQTVFVELANSVERRSGATGQLRSRGESGDALIRSSKLPQPREWFEAEPWRQQRTPAQTSARMPRGLPEQSIPNSSMSSQIVAQRASKRTIV